MFVADSSNHRVLKVAKDGTQTTVGSGFGAPQRVAVDQTGNVFVSDSGTVIKVRTDGTMANIASGISNPLGVAVDTRGNVFVADGTGYQVLEIAPDGTRSSMSEQSPNGLAVDATGNLYVALSSGISSVAVVQNGPVNFFGLETCPSPNGTGDPAPGFYSQGCGSIGTFTYNITAGGSFGTSQVVTDGAPNLAFTVSSNTCSGNLTTGSSCTVAVTFSPKVPGLRRGAVQVVDTNGNVLATTYVYGYGLGPQLVFDTGVRTKFGASVFSPYGVVVDGNNNVFFSDFANQSLLKFGSDGSLQRRVLVSQSNLSGLALDGTGNVYIASSDKILRYSADLLTSTIVATGLNNAISLAVDAKGNLYIAEGAQSDVLKVPSDGTAPTRIATPGNPTSVAVDAVGNLYLTISNVNTSSRYPRMEALKQTSAPA